MFEHTEQALHVLKSQYAEDVWDAHILCERFLALLKGLLNAFPDDGSRDSAGYHKPRISFVPIVLHYSFKKYCAATALAIGKCVMDVGKSEAITTVRNETRTFVSCIHLECLVLILHFHFPTFASVAAHCSSSVGPPPPPLCSSKGRVNHPQRQIYQVRKQRKGPWMVRQEVHNRVWAKNATHVEGLWSEFESYSSSR